MNTQSPTLKKHGWRHFLMARYWGKKRAARIVSGGIDRWGNPQITGNMAKGRQIMAGNLQLAGELVTIVDQNLWKMPLPSQQFEQDLHGFLWLDDLSALGTPEAREFAQQALWGWIMTHGDGENWQVGNTARRVLHWNHSAPFILETADPALHWGFLNALVQQALFLGRYWKQTDTGVERFEALCAQAATAMSFVDMGSKLPRILKALEQETRQHIAPDGTITSRNPQELTEIFALLVDMVQRLQDRSKTVPVAISQAITAMAPILRNLRHSNGALPRFHGGGRGVAELLDRALALSQIKADQTLDQAMGYARVNAGMNSLILDAAHPPSGRGGHASTGAFEFSSGQNALIVNCGSGASYGADWNRAGRATPSHSTLCLDGMSSARFGTDGQTLSDGPQNVNFRKTRAIDGTRLQVAHDGYRSTHGMVHHRTLDLSLNGHGLAGEDSLKAQNSAGLAGVPFALRFHLHPDIEAEIDMGGKAVSLILGNEETWVFRHDGHADLSLDPSAYLEWGRLNPRAADQIVLRGVAEKDVTIIRWSLVRLS